MRGGWGKGGGASGADVQWLDTHSLERAVYGPATWNAETSCPTPHPAPRPLSFRPMWVVPFPPRQELGLVTILVVDAVALAHYMEHDDRDVLGMVVDRPLQGNAMMVV